MKTAILDKAGKPLRMYHGSKNLFSAFDLNRISDYAHFGGGFYFAANYNEARQHIWSEELHRADGYIYEVELDISNPLRTMGNLITKTEFQDMDALQVREFLIQKGYDGVAHIYWDGELYPDSVVVAFYPEQIRILKIHDLRDSRE